MEGRGLMRGQSVVDYIRDLRAKPPLVRIGITLALVILISVVLTLLGLRP